MTQDEKMKSADIESIGAATNKTQSDLLIPPRTKPTFNGPERDTIRQEPDVDVSNENLLQTTQNKSEIIAKTK